MPLDEAYFVWLYSQVGPVDTRNRSKTYWDLLRFLYKKKFIWSKHMERDGNRAQDGKDLRQVFLNETGHPPPSPDWLYDDCSVLEMLLALAQKIAFESLDEDVNSAFWFWRMIENVGLYEFTDANPPTKETVDLVFDRVMLREYEKNGYGGLFPLQHHQSRDDDQRNVELWYQGQAYLLEHI